MTHPTPALPGRRVYLLAVADLPPPLLAALRRAAPTLLAAAARQPGLSAVADATPADAMPAAGGGGRAH